MVLLASITKSDDVVGKKLLEMSLENILKISILKMMKNVIKKMKLGRRETRM